MTKARPLAVIGGASTGIGYEIARVAAENGFDLVIAADEPEIESAAAKLAGHGGSVLPVEADLATDEGIARLHVAARRTGRPVELLVANAGLGVGGTFLDQDFDEVRRAIDTNVTGTMRLVQVFGRDMRAVGHGRIIITSSVAGLMPGPFHAVYNASKALLHNLSFALRNELRETGVTVTCLMPGATHCAFFRRNDIVNTGLGQAPKDDPGPVAEAAFAAAMRGEADVVPHWWNKAMLMAARAAPEPFVAELHRHVAKPRAGPLDGPAAARRLARGLGWLSLVLGAIRMVAPARVARVTGRGEQGGLVAAHGVRELATGAAILAADDPEPGLRARAAGDGLELATLAAAGGPPPGRGARAGTAAAVAGAALVTLACAAILRKMR